jgi:predicted PurR-regulated permease PerM
MNTFKVPFYAKASLIFIGLFAFISMLFIGQSIIVPIIYAIMIAILLSPMVRFFVNKKLNRILAISITLGLVSLLTILFVVLLSSQLSRFTDSLPIVVDKFYEILDKTVLWASGNYNISTEHIDSFLNETKIEILNGSKSYIASTLSTMGNALVILILIPVYVFMILYYQPLLLAFIRQLFGAGNQLEVNEILTSTKTIIHKYLVGLLIEAAIVAALNSIGLLIIGIDYAIILGVIGAVLNVIPYIGGFIAVALFMMVALVTKSSPTYAVLAAVVFVIIQFIDNHFIIPKIVASKVRINALMSVIVVLAGGALWGVGGMFLSIPLTAIIKTIFDHIELLKPWGYLLGDTMPTKDLFKLKLKK